MTKQVEKPITDYKECLQQIVCKEPNANCHLDECNKCPGTTDLSRNILQFLYDNNIHEIQFGAWTSTDRSFLQTQLLHTDDFVEELCKKLMLLKPHSFIAKQQIQYFENRKRNLQPGEVLITLDFSENYKYVVQDASQAYHFNNDQCTVFTVVYYFTDESELKHKSLIFLSDSTTHDTAAVYPATIITSHYKKCKSKENYLL